MTADQLTDQFQMLWDNFAQELDSFYEEAAALSQRPEGPSLHETFQQCYWTPKHGLQKVLRRADDEKVNVGSATGMFFEQMASALIEKAVRERLGGVVVERNQTTHPVLRGIRNQPDLVLRRNESGGVVVFEFKAAPKKHDLEGVRGQRREFLDSDIAVRFFLIGGYVSRAKGPLDDYLSEGWSTFLQSSDRNRPVIEAGPTLDDLVDEAVVHISHP